MAINKTDRSRRRASNVLSAFNILFLTAAVAIIVKIFILQYVWEPDPKYINYFKPKKIQQPIEPERGSIIDHNGKLLAISTPMYNVYMDCYIRKEAHDNDKDAERGSKNEAEWVKKANLLAEALPSVLAKDGRNAAYYKDLIFTGRRNKRQYVLITKGIDHGTLLKLKSLPLFNESTYMSGMIVEKEDTRQYPYDELARRVIGYVKHNNDTNSYHIGIEGKYDYVLHGKKGHEWKKTTDKKAMISDPDSTVVAVEDGLDVRTTLDINIQDIADRALRRNISSDGDIEGGCVVVLDVETGAVRAMVNLSKDSKGAFRERFNMSVGTAAEPGSVFKTVALMTLLEDGHISLDTEIPTNHGIMKDMSLIPQDRYITNYENRTKKSRISVLEGFEISSNYVFRRLIKDNYGEDPQEYFNRLHEYNFGEAYKFELSDGQNILPSVPDAETSASPLYDLVATAIGYRTNVTPLQVATFYNAIANNGKMMKPYIVESHEFNGRKVKEFKPALLNGSICSKATADTITRALTMVTLEGTASKLKNAKCTVAGKTGTSRIYLEESGRYENKEGQKKHQATFVGFFPAEAPKYTAIVVVYTGLIKHDVYGGNIPVLTFKEIADALWAYDSGWGNELKDRGEVPQMRAEHISTAKKEESPVPDVNGLGLKDALYAIENNGYRCRHKGTGHVVSQTPKAGSKLAKGQTISIILN